MNEMIDEMIDTEFEVADHEVVSLVEKIKSRSPTIPVEDGKLFLKGAYLKGANLEGANLTNTNLTKAFLVGANLKGANLIDATLTDAYLRSVELNDAILINAVLKNASLSNAKLNNAQLNHANLTQANLQQAVLQGANLFGANLFRACLRGVELNDAILSNADLRMVSLNETNFTNADLNNANFSDTTNFRNANLSGTCLDLRRYLPNITPVEIQQFISTRQLHTLTDPKNQYLLHCICDTLIGFLTGSGNLQVFHNAVKNFFGNQERQESHQAKDYRNHRILPQNIVLNASRFTRGIGSFLESRINDTLFNNVLAIYTSLRNRITDMSEQDIDRLVLEAVYERIPRPIIGEGRRTRRRNKRGKRSKKK